MHIYYQNANTSFYTYYSNIYTQYVCRNAWKSTDGIMIAHLWHYKWAWCPQSTEINLVTVSPLSYCSGPGNELSTLYSAHVLTLSVSIPCLICTLMYPATPHVLGQSSYFHPCTVQTMECPIGLNPESPVIGSCWTEILSTSAIFPNPIYHSSFPLAEILFSNSASLNLFFIIKSQSTNNRCSLLVQQMYKGKLFGPFQFLL